MHLHNKQRSVLISSILLILSVLLTACGYQRIGIRSDASETGEFYQASQDHLDQNHSGNQSTNQQSFDEFCLTVFRDEMEDADTLDLHYTLLHPETYGITPKGISLGTCSLTDMIAANKKLEDLKSRLETYDRDALTSNQKITYDALMETLNTALMAAGLELYEQPLAPTIGVQAQLPILLAEYSFHSLKDVEDYITLLTQMDRYYNEILAFEIQKANAGLGPSDASIDNIIKSCESYLIDPEDNFLTETFETRLTALETSENISLTLDQKNDLRERHAAAIRDHFVPAYQSLIEGMKTLKGRGLNDSGLAGYADGKKYYEYLLKSGPGVSYSVSELKSALSSRMKQDYEAINVLFAKYPDLAEKIPEAAFSMTDPTEILEHLKKNISKDFPTLADCGYEVRYVPKYLESSLSPAFYLTAPLDDTNQNVIYINNGCTDGSDSLYTTLAHEGFPGHLYQTVYNRTYASMPLMSILSCSGANEGWATYVENYACTMDSGLPDGVGEYRALIRSFSLCVHGILDIGINYDGWTKEEAREFITACFQTEENTVDELWQIMIDNPTNYLDYCGGYVEIMEMRKEAETALGSCFSPKEFHQFLLDIGPVPFSVIRSNFHTWLSGQISR